MNKKSRLTGEWRLANYARWLELNRRNSMKQRSRYKKLVFEHYGSQCACCGERERAFLTIDHIGGGGGKHRRSIGMKSGSSFYQWLVVQGYPDGFRVLCWNCNQSLGVHGYCPHQRALQDAGLALWQVEPVEEMKGREAEESSR